MTTIDTPAEAARDADASILRVAAVCGIAGQVIFVVLWLVWGFIEKNYGVMRQDVSDFGALDASHPLPYNVILSITGALTLPLAYALYRVLRPGVLPLLGSLAIAVFAIGEFLDGLLREDCSPSGNAVCRQAADAGTLSWHHTAHDLESIVTIAAVILAPLLLAFVFRRRDGWRDLTLYAFLTPAVTAAFIAIYAILFFAHDGSPVNGLLERAAIVVGLAFLAAVSYRLWRLADEADTVTPAFSPPAAEAIVD